MRKRKMAIWGLMAFTLILIYASYKLMNARTYQLFGGLTSRVHTAEKAVALTFDDGPTKNAEAILSLLDEYDAKATFFLIGSELKNNMELGEKIAAAGHQIGNHTYSHERMVLKSPSFIHKEIERTNRLIRETGYDGEIDFRPPNGKKLIGLPYYLKRHHIETITWSLEPDTFYSSPSDKVSYVVKHVKPGDIILLHPMYDESGDELKTIEGILRSLSKKGYRFVTVNELQKMQK